MSCSGRTMRSRLTVAVLGLGILALAGRADATPIADFTGNTFLGTLNPAGVDGTVNYAVFTGAQFSADAAAILSNFVPGDGSPAGLNLAGHVYLFQIANNGANAETITGISVGINGASPTSWGYFSDRIFVDNLGANVTATNNLGDDTTPLGGSGPRTGIGSVGFATLAAAVNPVLVSLIAGSSVDEFFLLPRFGGEGEVTRGSTASLLVYTSAEEPTFLFASISDAGTQAFGPVPGPVQGVFPVPEPATLLLLGSGLLGLAVLMRRTA